MVEIPLAAPQPVLIVVFAEDTEESRKWFVSETKYGPFVHAKLGIAEENSGKLIIITQKN